ncbi:MAG: molybdopterin synthase catalytic subunit MoaE [Pseudohongiellaceae bacterium]
MISVQEQDFDLAGEYSYLRESAGNAGAIVTFTGLVREFYEADAEQPVQRLFLEHYPGMTEKALDDIVSQAASRWDLQASRVIHRIGNLRPGDQIVFVGTASTHRHHAFSAAEFIMDYLKSRAPFWKKQHSADQVRWVESRTLDVDALKRWS